MPDGSVSSGALLSVSALVEDFGTVAVGAQGPSASVVVTNTGGAVTGPLTATVSGPDAASFLVDTDTCTGRVLAAQSHCSVQMHFAPTNAGTLVGSLAVTGQPGGTALVSLKGSTPAPDAGTEAGPDSSADSGVDAGMDMDAVADAGPEAAATPPAFQVTPSSYDFGSRAVGSTSPGQSFTVTNIGAMTSGVPAVAKSGANSNDFTVTSSCPAALPPQGTCTFAVTFTPSAASPEAATVTVSGPSTMPGATSLTGTGLSAAALALSPPSYDFMTVIQGGQSADYTFTVTNNGGSTSGALAVSLAGTYANQFQLGTQTCMGAQLAGSGAGTCTIKVHFQPTAAAVGQVQATLNVSGVPGGATSAAVSGTAATPALLSISPTPGNFMNVTQGTQLMLPFSVTNSGGSPSGVPTVTIVGTTDFTQTNNCTATIPANTSNACTINVTFAPMTTMTETATLSFSATPPGGSVQVPLSGMGVPPVPAITISPTSQVYPATANQQSMAFPSYTFTVTNNGTGTTNGLSIAGMANGFTLPGATDGCTGKKLAPRGGSCTFSVLFQPSAAQTPATTASATITVTDSATDTTSATVSGLVLSSTYYFVFTPNPGAWGNVPPGTGKSVTFTVTNYGVAAAPQIFGVSVLNAPNDPYFATMSSTCVNALLKPYGVAGYTCQHVETFSPPVGSAGSLPAGAALDLLGATGGPLASDPISASW